jgi:hypothetical protein
MGEGMSRAHIIAKLVEAGHEDLAECLISVAAGPKISQLPIGSIAFVESFHFDGSIRGGYLTLKKIG